MFYSIQYIRILIDPYENSTNLIILTAAGTASSQNYTPFPDSAATWVNTFYFRTSPPPSPTFGLSMVSNYCMDGRDTVINSNTYSNLYFCGGAYKGALRDDGGRVMYVPKDSMQEFLLYDLTLSQGDTAHNVYVETAWEDPMGLYDIHIGYVDSVLINGAYRKRMIANSAYWIEGIGNTWGLLREHDPNVSQYYVELHCMSANDTTLYPTTQPGSCDLTVEMTESNLNDEVLIYPNPSYGKFTAAGAGKRNIENVSIFNSQGQLISIALTISDRLIQGDLERYGPGMYWLVINTTEGNIIRKIIKQ